MNTHMRQLDRMVGRNYLYNASSIKIMGYQQTNGSISIETDKRTISCAMEKLPGLLGEFLPVASERESRMAKIGRPKNEAPRAIPAIPKEVAAAACKTKPKKKTRPAMRTDPDKKIKLSETRKKASEARKKAWETRRQKAEKAQGAKPLPESALSSLEEWAAGLPEPGAQPAKLTGEEKAARIKQGLAKRKERLAKEKAVQQLATQNLTAAVFESKPITEEKQAQVPATPASQPITPPASDMIHTLKTWPSFFDRIILGQKTFEVRPNDRDFQAGDILHLQEYNVLKGEYSGREVKAKVTYVLHGGQFGIQENYVVMAFELLKDKEAQL